MKSPVRWFVFLFFCGVLHAALPELRVADDRRHLETIEGKPFFLLGDTAWELFHRLNREETIAYLDNRAATGFNTILAVALAEYEFDQPNADGELPLEANDPTRPRDAYFRHVDWVVDQAARRGLYTGLLPTWGDKWNKQWGKGPEIFTPENAAVYGEWLGRRYKNQPVIWILGGDRSVDNDRHRAILRAMAAGLKKGDGGKHLVTYHPKGATNSSDSWPDEDWLDFHLFQSGHGELAVHNFDYNAKNLSLPALKPTLDGEPNYEDHPVRGLMRNGKPTVWFDAYDARRAAWWSALSGACGHVYGTHSIWQFHDPLKRKAVTDARTPWQDAMKLPGAAQVGIMGRFLDELPWWTLRRNDGFLTGKPKDGWNPEQVPMAAVSTDRNFALVYLPNAGIGGVGLDFKAMACSNNDVDVWILDPASGQRTPLPALESGALDGVFKDLPANPSRPLDRVLLIRKKTANPAGVPNVDSVVPK